MDARVLRWGLAVSLIVPSAALVAQGEQAIEAVPDERVEVRLPLGTGSLEGPYDVRVSSSQAGMDESGTLQATAAEGPQAAGSLHFVATPAWAEPGKPVAVDALFENTGNATIADARLTLEVFRDGELVETIESAPHAVDPGQQANLTALFIPEEPGDYELEGTVAYAGSQTDPQSASLEGRSQASEQGLLDAIPSWVFYVSMATKIGTFAFWRWRGDDEE